MASQAPITAFSKLRIPKWFPRHPKKCSIPWTEDVAEFTEGPLNIQKSWSHSQHCIRPGMFLHTYNPRIWEAWENVNPGTSLSYTASQPGFHHDTISKNASNRARKMAQKFKSSGGFAWVPSIHIRWLATTGNSSSRVPTPSSGPWRHVQACVTHYVHFRMNTPTPTHK